MRLVLAFLLAPLAAEAAPDCALPHDLGERVQTLKSTDAPRDEDLILRNPFGAAGNGVSEHFALYWGSDIDLAPDEVDDFLDGFEYAWESQVEAWGLDDPTGVEGTYFNVYLGDTGPEVPSAGGAGGYYTIDEEGFPYIVMGLGVFDDPDWADTVVAHEFFHAVQGASGAYWDFDIAGWYWEATANWAAGQVHPGNWSWAYSLGYYAFSPHFSVSTWANDGTMEPPNLHQYGAFIFPEYLTEFVDPVAVRRSWSVGGGDEDPLVVLDQIVGDLGVHFADHAAHNLNWDYARGELFEQMMESFAPQFAEWDHRITDVWADEDGWLAPEDDLEPERFAYNTIRLPEEALDGFTYEFEGDEGAWEHRLVFEGPAGIEYRWIRPDDVISALDTDEAFVVISSVPMDGGLFESRDYRLRPFVEPEPVPKPEDPVDPLEPTFPENPEDPGTASLSAGGSGCSCNSGGAFGGLLALLPLVRRRRATSRAAPPSRP